MGIPSDVMLVGNFMGSKFTLRTILLVVDVGMYFKLHKVVVVTDVLTMVGTGNPATSKTSCECSSDSW